MQTQPARIHCIIAREANVAIVFRRGPSKNVLTLSWNLDSDKFKIGQWLKGRIYTKRSDISPDGKRLIYFAMNGKWHTSSRGSWTAVSKVPYLKALEFFPQGDCWNGGGVFRNSEQALINGGGDLLFLAPLSGKFARHELILGNECLRVYVVRLLRDGWSLTQGRTSRSDSHPWVFERPLRKGITLRKIIPLRRKDIWKDGSPSYSEYHEVVCASGDIQVMKKWEWADVRKGAILFAEDGKLFRAGVAKSGAIDAKEVIDLNPYKFEPLVAPY